MAYLILGLIVSYLLGSIPTAYLFGRAKGIDIRQHGSGNVGATNALRVLGKAAGITVLFLDVLKGFLAVIVLGDILIKLTPVVPAETARIILGIACICGHNWTVFLKFKGGKGVATTFGVLIGLAFKVFNLPIVLGLVILIWFLTFFFSRIVSLSSVAASIALPVFTVFFKLSLTIIIASLVLSVFSLFRHKGNLVRLFQGKEPRLSFKKVK